MHTTAIAKYERNELGLEVSIVIRCYDEDT
jgi:hypothetical protein